MADRVVPSPCELHGEHRFRFSVRIGINPDCDTCYCGAVKWADVAPAVKAEPPPERTYGLSMPLNTGAGQRDVAIARANEA